MKVKRRRFLEASAASLVASSWPGFIQRAFASVPDPSCPRDEAPTDSTSSCEALLDAHRQARAAARPLLVIVIPENRRERHARGTLFGSYINWGDDAALALLGLCEVACASSTHIRVLVPFEASSEAEPLAVLIEPDSASGRRIDGKIPRIEYEYQPSDGLAVDRALASLARLLRSAIATESARAAQLASSARVTELARQARSRLKDQRIPGSKWANTMGCGSRVELLPGETDTSFLIACGMGSVPEKARRMLHFWADPRELRAS